MVGIRWREVGLSSHEWPPCPLAAHVQLPVTWLVHHAGIAVKPGHRQSPISLDPKNRRYCWWKKSQTTTWDIKNPVNNGINYQPQLVQDFFREQYYIQDSEAISGSCLAGTTDYPERNMANGQLSAGKPLYTSINHLRWSCKWTYFILEFRCIVLKL